jgi:hypothetical protein
MKKFTVSTLVFALGISIGLTTAALSKEKDEDADDANDEATIQKLTLVRDAGETFEKVESFKPTDTLGVLVKLSGPKAGTKVKGVWTVVDAGGMKDKKIFEKEVAMTADVLKTAKEKDRVDFTLSHDNPYPTGAYKFDVYLNGELADTVEFEVE